MCALVLHYFPSMNPILLWACFLSHRSCSGFVLSSDIKVELRIQYRALLRSSSYSANHSRSEAALVTLIGSDSCCSCYLDRKQWPASHHLQGLLLSLPSGVTDRAPSPQLISSSTITPLQGWNVLTGLTKLNKFRFSFDHSQHIMVKEIFYSNFCGGRQ